MGLDLGSPGSCPGLKADTKPEPPRLTLNEMCYNIFEGILCPCNFIQEILFNWLLILLNLLSSKKIIWRPFIISEIHRSQRVLGIFNGPI